MKNLLPTTLLLVLCMLWVPVALQAQMYKLTTLTQSYKALENPISLNKGKVWDDPEYAIFLGFDFTLSDKTSNVLYIEDIGLGAYISTTQTEQGTAPLLVVYGPDIIDRGYDLDHSESEISYEITGDAGNKIAKFQWANFGFFGDLDANDTCVDYGNVQVWFYQGSNNFEIRFGPSSITRKDLAYEIFPGPFMGIIEHFNFDSLDISGIASFLTGNPSNPTLTHADSISYMNDNVPANMVYQFSKKGTGIAEKTTLPLSFYPNPAGNLLHLNYHGNQGGTLRLLNSMGGLMLEVVDQAPNVDVSNLARGVYIAEYEQDGEFFRSKLALH